jgi:hypothetical protein
MAVAASLNAFATAALSNADKLAGTTPVAVGVPPILVTSVGFDSKQFLSLKIV